MAAKDPDIDRLTGVLTRPALDAAAEAAVGAAAGGELIAFGYIGLDGFSILKEEYGSVVTDHLLRETASRIMACVRPQDVVGRVERDEFMIVFRELTSKFETLALASKLRTSIAEPMRAGKTEEYLAPSCGIAQYPANGKTVRRIARRRREVDADAASCIAFGQRCSRPRSGQPRARRARSRSRFPQRD